MKRGNMKKIILFLTIISIYAYSDIIGNGIGETEILAKKSALDELSQQIEVNVDSLFYTEENYDGSQYTKNSVGVINLLSNNFLFGVEYEIQKIGKNYSAKAVISKDKMSFYEEKAKDSYSLTKEYFEKGKVTKSIGEKKGFLLAALKELNKGDSYKNISMLLGSKIKWEATTSELSIKEELQKIKDLNLDKAVVYVSLEEEKYNSVKNLVGKSIARIARENQYDLILGDKDFNNTILVVKVTSCNQETVPPFYYNNKKMSDTVYKTDLVLSFILKDSISGKVYDSFSFENSSKSFLSSEDSINLSTKRILQEADEQITIALGNIFY